MCEYQDLGTVLMGNTKSTLFAEDRSSLVSSVPYIVSLISHNSNLVLRSTRVRSEHRIFSL
jgi:hypothetical protein